MMGADGMMGGACAGGMGVGLLLFLVLLGAVGYLAYRYGLSQRDAQGSSKQYVRSENGSLLQADEANDLVRRRYAQGEISREEFEQLRRDLA